MLFLTGAQLNEVLSDVLRHDQRPHRLPEVRLPGSGPVADWGTCRVEARINTYVEAARLRHCHTLCCLARWDLTPHAVLCNFLWMDAHLYGQPIFSVLSTELLC